MESTLFDLNPLLANALSFALEKATMEGKLTIGMLVLVSLFSWTVIINKARQLYRSTMAVLAVNIAAGGIGTLCMTLGAAVTLCWGAVRVSQGFSIMSHTSSL